MSTSCTSTHCSSCRRCQKIILKAPHRCAGAGSLGLCTVQHEQQMQELPLVTAYFGLVTVQHEQHVPELPCITERTTFSFTVLGTDKLPCYMPPPALCSPVALAITTSMQLEFKTDLRLQNRYTLSLITSAQALVTFSSGRQPRFLQGHDCLLAIVPSYYLMVTCGE